MLLAGGFDDRFFQQEDRDVIANGENTAAGGTLEPGWVRQHGQGCPARGAYQNVEQVLRDHAGDFTGKTALVPHSLLGSADKLY